MKANRLKDELRGAIYHVFNRVAGRLFLFTDDVKQQFRIFLYQVSVFCGVDVITYALMTDHFHILVKVQPKDTPVPESKVIERVTILYGAPDGLRLKNKLAFLREQGREMEAEELLDSYRIRMNDISEFMKALESRMTIYYNNTHDREGTLWQSRFGSVIMEAIPNLELLRTVAAYIDLNPVRAKLAVVPSKYGWCGSGDPLFAGGLAYLFPKAMLKDRAALYSSYLRKRSAKKGYEKLAPSGLPDLFETLIRNVILTRARAIGTPAFIASLVGDHPPGGITVFDGGGGEMLQTVGCLTRRKRKPKAS